MHLVRKSEFSVQKSLKKNERSLLNASEIINHHLFLSSFRKDYCLEKSLKE